MQYKLKAPFVPDIKDLKFQECNWEKEKMQAKVIAGGEDPFMDW